MDPSNLMFLFAPSAYWSLLAFACYLVLVRALRYRRRDHLQYSFNYPTRASYARMTIEDAHAIQLALARLEFPQTFTNSVFFALFKVWHSRRRLAHPIQLTSLADIRHTNHLPASGRYRRACQRDYRVEARDRYGRHPHRGYV